MKFLKIIHCAIAALCVAWLLFVLAGQLARATMGLFA